MSKRRGDCAAPLGIIARAVRRGATISVLILSLAMQLAAVAHASSGDSWRTLTIHQAWAATVKGARHVAQNAGRGAYAEVQPQSACVRHSPYQVDCPFAYLIGFRSDETYEICRDTGRVTEVAEQRLRFTSLKPRCQFIVNKTP